MGWMLKAAGILRPVPKPIRKGDTLKQIMITHTGYKNPDYFALLLKNLNNALHKRGIEQIFCCCEKGHSLLKGLKGFIKIDTDINLYIKHLQKGGFAKNRPVYISGIDM